MIMYDERLYEYERKSIAKTQLILLVLAAFIWGIAFVAQSEGGNSDHIHLTASVFYWVPLSYVRYF